MQHHSLAMASKSHHYHLLLFLILLHVTITTTTNTNPDVFLTVCGTSIPKDLGSFYVNRAATMASISANVTKSGFAIAVTGNAAADTAVYGLAQCFDYLPSLDCQLCFGWLLQTMSSRQCLPADGRVYLDGCFHRIADYSFFNAAVDKKDASQCSNSSALTSNTTMLKENVGRLMSNLTLGAGKSSRFYMVGSTEATPGLTVYGMAQCWRSLNASGCRDCLESGRESVGRCLPASDGKAMNAGCFVRYSTLPFYLESTAGSNGSSVHRSQMIAVLGSVFGALLIIGIGIAIWWTRKKVTYVTTKAQEDSEIIKAIAASSLSFKYEELQDVTDNFSEKNKLGQGGFGAVYKGVLPDGTEIAVKRLFFNTRQRVDQFFSEVTLVNQIQHKNLVKLLGCSVEGPESLLVYEYLCNTSLEKFLYDRSKKHVLDYGKRFDIIVGTAEGLAYLHSSSEVRIIHRDIKASNVLLDERFKPKIADFGLARYFADDETHISTGLAGTFGYMAPEYIVHGQLTEKADIYSYGMLVIEIITGRKITCPSFTEGQSLMSTVWQHFNSRSLIELIDEDLVDQCSQEEALKVFHVGLLCAQASAILRPPMWKVVEMLTSVSEYLPPPSVPAFINVMGADSTHGSSDVSSNQMTTSTVYGR